MKCTFSVSVCQSQIHLNSMAQQPDHKIIFMVLDYWYKSFSSSKWYLISSIESEMKKESFQKFTYCLTSWQAINCIIH